MQRRKHHSFIIIALIALSLFLIGYYAAPKLGLKGFTPVFFGMKKINENIYSQIQTTDFEETNLKAVVDSAMDSIKVHFGSLKSKPYIIACSDEACYRRFTGERSRGKTFFDFWIVLSPRGRNVMILTHELTHSEVHKRIGFYSTFFEIPTWLDEGYATWLSHDPRCVDSSGILEQWKTENRNEKLKKIWKSQLKPNGLAYNFACFKFQQWYKTNGENGLREVFKN